MDIKIYLHDASENLRQILPDAAFIRFDDFGNVLLEGKFSPEDLGKIINIQAEVIGRLALMRKELATAQ